LTHRPTEPTTFAARAPEAIGDSGWRQTILKRVTSDVPLKAGSTMLGIALFFAAYFWVLHHPLGTVTTMPVLAPDRWLDFEVVAMPLYLSLWAYVSLGPALLPDRRSLLGYGVACGAIAGIGLILFLLLPTKVPPLMPEDAAEAATHAGMALLRGVDLAGNACPSLHVAFALFAAIGLARELRSIGAPPWLRALNATWCAGIVYSTLATRQHVVLDVLAGAFLAVLVALPHAAWSRRGAAGRRTPPVAARPVTVRSAVGEP